MNESFFPNLLFCCFYLDFGVFVIFEAFGGYDSGKYSPPRSCSVSIWFLVELRRFLFFFFLSKAIKITFDEKIDVSMSHPVTRGHFDEKSSKCLKNSRKCPWSQFFFFFFFFLRLIRGEKYETRHCLYITQYMNHEGPLGGVYDL